MALKKYSREETAWQVITKQYLYYLRNVILEEIRIEMEKDYNIIFIYLNDCQKERAEKNLAYEEENVETDEIIGRFRY